DAISPKITNTATQTATIDMGKTKNWRTRNGVVWRSGAASAGGSVPLVSSWVMRRLLGPGPVPDAPERELHVHDEGLGGVLELVQAAMELGVVGRVRLVGLGQVLEARGPLHQALQAGLAVGVHVGGLGAAHVEAAHERADLAAPVLGALDHGLERAARRGRARRQHRLDGAGLEALRHRVRVLLGLG